jgi:3-oxoacyl-[acyl-carrier protein] reductase
VALITGAGGGIGRETALLLAAEGAAVAAADLNLATAEATVAVIAAAEPAARATAIALDVTSEAGVRASVAEAERRLGAVDVLVNCAGIYRVGEVDTVTLRAWSEVLATNLTGAFLMCQVVLPGMLARGRGSIVNLSSISGRTRSTLAAPSYVASKAGVIGLTMSLAAQVAGRGVRVNAVAPGPTDTDMIRTLPEEQRARLASTIPLGRLGAAREVASAIVFLASDAAAFITGETLNVNGGAFMV